MLQDIRSITARVGRSVASHCLTTWMDARPPSSGLGDQRLELLAMVGQVDVHGGWGFGGFQERQAVGRVLDFPLDAGPADAPEQDVGAPVRQGLVAGHVPHADAGADGR